MGSVWVVLANTPASAAHSVTWLGSASRPALAIRDQLTLTSHKTHKMVKLAKIEGQPKRPMSAYFLWMNEEGREAAKKKHSQALELPKSQSTAVKRGKTSMREIRKSTRRNR